MSLDKSAIERVVLESLSFSPSIESSSAFAKQKHIDHNTLIGVLFSLQASEMVLLEQKSSEELVLTEQGEECRNKGSPECVTWRSVPKEGILKSELMQILGDSGKFGFAQAMKKKWIALDKEKVIRSVDEVKDETQDLLTQISANPDPASISSDLFKDLRKRKLVSLSKTTYYSVGKGSQFSLEKKQKATEITLEMLKSGEWKDKSFKSVNLNAKGKEIVCGALHPLLKMRAAYRTILLEMGFEEMPTNNFVESSFWNFDALFQPQQHPARDAHDTFFLENPKECGEIQSDYLERVKTMHERGGSGSIGWRYDWKLSEAKKNLLRTHTTAVSTRMLYKLAQEKEFKPRKYFSIDRVFRNETVDQTHLAEFHQIEGLIADRNLTLGHLIGTIKTFFEKIGIPDVKFKPAYNPYTEPSMEIFGYSPEMDRWMEIGNSGIFRPEMLLPMGLPEDVRVIAWGFGLERPTMISYKFSDIRDLSGHKVNLKLVQQTPDVRFE